MFLHIGADKEVLAKDVISILNIDSINNSKITNEFIDMAKEDEFVKIISKDPPKSIVITEESKKNVLYFSPISSTTLQKRIYSIENLLGVKGKKEQEA